MTSLEQLVMRSAGVVTRRQLDEIGVGETVIRALLRHGTLRRLRNGWYATPVADPRVVRAVAAGGVLTCLDALRRHGVWIPEHPQGLHLRPPARGARVSVARACRVYGDVHRAASAIDDVATALRYAARCLDHEGFVVVCDSALNSGLVTSDELHTSLIAAPQHIRNLIDRCDGNAQSGTETMVRLRLRSKNIAVTTQHHVPSVGHVDLLVGDRLVIEVDSVAHHTGVDRYESDRTRDRLLAQLGYLPLRFTYRQVVHDWASCEDAVIDLVRRRAHHRSRRDRR